MKLREAAQQALEALESSRPIDQSSAVPHNKHIQAIFALRAALAEPVQEPVAWIEHEWSGTGQRRLHFEKRQRTVRDEVVNPVWTPLYLAPLQRKPLTEEEIGHICAPLGFAQLSPIEVARAIEKAHGIGGSND